VGFEELRHVEFRSSENLDLSDVDVVERVDALVVSRRKVRVQVEDD